MARLRTGRVAPSRGRGLKRIHRPWSVRGNWVAPSRGRGLKHLGVGQLVSQHQVAPSRGRGLKHLGEIYGCSESGRPFTGAWIETWVDEQEKVEAKGRPFTGAWIETNFHLGYVAGAGRSPLHGGVD